MTPKKTFLFIIFQFFILMGKSQISIPLYPDSIPNSKITADNEKSRVNNGILLISQISRPSLTVFSPKGTNIKHTAIIICPGGGYWVEAAGHEGSDVAEKLSEWGYTAILLKYRIPNDSTMVNREIGPIQDAQRAIQWIRENARKYKIKKNRIGIMGFSAGGHLASTAGTHFEKNYIENPKKISLRPDFMVLIYPVISFTDSVGHLGSRTQLLGPKPSEEKIKEYSNELQVGPNTPPAYLVHAKNDPIHYQNSLLFYNALQKNGVPSELYLYELGGHGYGMNNPSSAVKWMDGLKIWMNKKGFI